MVLKSRMDLKSQFKNGLRPSEKDFCNLIDSMLNKRDDSFMGLWKAGMAYKTGDVVIYNQALWTVPFDKDGNPQEICSNTPPAPGDEWESLIVPISDNDWEVDEEAGIMYANIFGCVGIGGRFLNTANVPEAKLDIDEENKGRFLILPKLLTVPSLSLFRYGEDAEKGYFLNGLADDHVGFTTDAPAGFYFRRGLYCEPGEEAFADFRSGQILMVVQPDTDGLPRVGIGTPIPKAMLDITDHQKGQFLFNPEDKTDPAFTIVNLDPITDKNYLASGVGVKNAVFVTDAPMGFLFKMGGDYDTYCAESDINQGNSLMIVTQNDNLEPRVGIGTEEPSAMLDITDGTRGQFLVNPEDKDNPAITIVNLDSSPTKDYLALGVGDERSVLITDSPKGFVFKRGEEYGQFCNESNIDQGEKLVVILAEGNVGIGTQTNDPEVRLEVTDDRQTGQFLFNLDDQAVNPALAICNLRPTEDSFLTIGIGNQTSTLFTNSENGLSIRSVYDTSQNTNKFDPELNNKTMMHLRPERMVGGTITQKNKLRIFPEAENESEVNLFPLNAAAVNYNLNQNILRVFGKIGVLRNPKNYELDLNGTARSFGYYINTDSQKMNQVNNLEDVLDKVLQLKPVSFYWSAATGHQGEGEQLGFFAHEVEEHFPQVVKNTPDDEPEDQTRSVAYQNLVPVLVQAIKEQQDMIADLVQRVEQLEQGA